MELTLLQSIVCQLGFTETHVNYNRCTILNHVAGGFERIGYDVICSLCYTFVPKHIATNVSYAALLLYLMFLLFPMN